jgi:PAS domain S-box-containing protein
MTNDGEGKIPTDPNAAHDSDGSPFLGKSSDAPGHVANDVEALRQRAEARWQGIVKKSPVVFDPTAARDPRTLLHELQVHQIELELQNEELRQARDALEVSRARYVDLYDLAPVSYCSVRLGDGMVVQANLTLASLLGLTRSALVNRPFSSHVVREDQDAWYRLRKQCMASEATQTCELRLHDVQETSFWVLLSARAVADSDGSREMHLALRDVSAMRTMRDLLTASEERYRSLAEDMPLFMATALPNGLLTYVNGALADCMGDSQQNLVGRNCLDFLNVEDQARARALVARLTPKQPVATHERRWTAAEGHDRAQQWTVRAFFGEAEKLLRLQAIGQNITLVNTLES